MPTAAKPAYIDSLMEDIISLPEYYTVQLFEFVNYLKYKAANQEQSADRQYDETSRLTSCPICAKLRDPVTGEPLYNAETKAAIKEADDMLSGKIPNTMKSFSSLEEMLKDLDADD